MSNTKRKIRKGYMPTVIAEGSDSQSAYHNGNLTRSKKMKPYAVIPLPGKFKASKTANVNGWQKGVTKTDKLVTKNANRSIKKAVRQQTQKLINKEKNSYE